MKLKITALLLFVNVLLQAQEQQPQDKEIQINEFIIGSLLVPDSVENPPLVILIQGSGTTDRNGNQDFMKNNSFKMIARELAENGIASFRYDKRTMYMNKLGVTEGEMRFDDFITDAISVHGYFEDQGGFGKTIFLGHSQGSLVGMIAAKDKADAFISISGPGQTIDAVIVEQLSQQVPGLVENMKTTFAEMREKGSSSSYIPVLENIFRPSLQPFLISWMKFDPTVEIAKLEIPVMIIGGTKDLQVPEKEAHLLKEANPEAQMLILENMNHVLKEITSDDTLENSKSYNEPQRPLHPELIPAIVGFIKGLE